jgi:zinc finger protein
MATLPTAESWNEGTEENVSIIRDCYCVNCNSSNGVTTVLPTKVPFFRQVIVMSFACNECNFRNSDVSFGGEIQLQGEIISLHVTQEQDLSRQIVKSDSASLTIPQLAFEIPPGTQRGSISTVEGMLRRAADNLDRLQPERLRLGDLDNFYRCQRVLQSLRFFVGVSENNGDDQRFPFDIILDDPAGNSFIENPLAPSADANLKSVKYTRSPHQDLSLGLKPAGAKGDNASRTKIVGRVQRESDDSEWEKKEVFKFPTTCPYCNHHVEANMCLTDIPHFRQVIIMSLLCENCGFRSNEIKGGGAIPKFGTKITVKVQTPEDLSREVLKSDTAGVVLPELKLELNEGGLDGLYTTIEGLLNKIHDRLEFANPFCAGDSAQKQHLGNDGGEFLSLLQAMHATLIS